MGVFRTSSPDDVVWFSRGYDAGSIIAALDLLKVGQRDAHFAIAAAVALVELEDIGFMLGVADGADDVPPAGEQEGGQEESDLAVPAEQEDAGNGHVCFLAKGTRHKIISRGLDVLDTWTGGGLSLSYITIFAIARCVRVWL